MRTEKLNDTQHNLVLVNPKTQIEAKLLFDLANNKWWTTTLRMAKALGKRNKDIMKNFKTHEYLYAMLVDGSNIRQSSYVGGNGKTNPMWILDERGFTAIMTTMTGATPSSYSVDFSRGLTAMRNVLDAHGISNHTLSTLRTPAHLATSEDTVGHLSMSTYANMLKQSNINIGRTRLYAVLREMGLVSTDNAPTAKGLDYLECVRTPTPKGNFTYSTKVKANCMLTLTNVIEHHYINMFIERNKLINLVGALRDMMRTNPNISNVDLIELLQNNLPYLKTLNDTTK